MRLCVMRPRCVRPRLPFEPTPGLRLTGPGYGIGHTLYRTCREWHVDADNASRDPRGADNVPVIPAETRSGEAMSESER